MGHRATWLCPSSFHRERLLDMEARLGPARAAMFVALGIALASGIPWFGWWILAPLAWVIAFYRLLGPWMARTRYPEYPIALSVVNAQLMLGIAIALSGGPRSPALPMMLLGVVTLPARFSERGVVAGVIFTCVVMVASSVGVDPAGYLDDPTFVNASLGCVVGLAAISYALMRAELFQRAHAILDPLPGLLNRQSLADRFVEIAEQAKLTGGWVALIACDLDHFKAVNDEHGHDRGDTVLKDAAYEIRRTMRLFELVYRMGGEEFLIVLPGANLDEAQRLAERARVCLEEARPGGLTVTASMGVVAARGEDVELGSLFHRADAALYAAKRDGRNRVVALEHDAAVAA
jgi:diguanylate cyclase (GGDEF)-like protein